MKRETEMGLILWKVQKFNELTPRELYDLLRLRVDVFVVEQNCPYPELDGRDLDAGTRHLAAFTANQGLAAYLRILAPGLSYPGVTIGRVVTAKEFRGNGLGHALIEKAMELAWGIWPDTPLYMGAQNYLRAFYESHGFEAISEIYLEDGIPHLDMIRKPG